MKLADELDAAGWTLDEEDFRVLVSRAFTRHFQGWTDEQLCCRPRDAMHFCNIVRQLAMNVDIPDDLILRTLSKVRKRG